MTVHKRSFVGTFSVEMNLSVEQNIVCIQTFIEVPGISSDKHLSDIPLQLVSQLFKTKIPIN
jgi:hypothetical protein